MFYAGDSVHLYEYFVFSPPDSSDRFKTLKTESILPYIWPYLNPLAISH